MFTLLFYTQSHAQGGQAWYDFDALAEILELRPGSWMADIGANDGFYLNRFLPILGEDGHIFAVDISTRGFERLHRNMERWQANNISTIYSMETNPLLPASSLDAILIRNAYHEFFDPKQMLFHLKRALKPDGLLVISEPMNNRHQGTDRRTQEEDHVLDIKFAIRDLEESGFRIVRKTELFSQHPQSGMFYWLLVTQTDLH
ncbi:MAG: class I SAM-dependent methyltransferase [Balneolaceae bacterium]